MVERLNGIEEVTGSNPVGSTYIFLLTPSVPAQRNRNQIVLLLVVLLPIENFPNDDEEENEDEGAAGGPGPDAEPAELPSRPVLLGHHPKPRGSECAAPDLEVPPIEVASAQDGEPGGAKRPFQCSERLAGRLPRFAPDP